MCIHLSFTRSGTPISRIRELPTAEHPPPPPPARAVYLGGRQTRVLLCTWRSRGPTRHGRALRRNPSFGPGNTPPEVARGVTAGVGVLCEGAQRHGGASRPLRARASRRSCRETGVVWAPGAAHFSNTWESGSRRPLALPSPCLGKSGCRGVLILQMLHVRTEAMEIHTADGASRRPARGTAR